MFIKIIKDFFSKLSLRTFMQNIYTLFAYDIRTLLLETRDRLIIESMRHFYGNSDSEPYHEELEYVFRRGLMVFPYEQVKVLETVESGYDKHLRMPYVIHKGEKAVFP